MADQKQTWKIVLFGGLGAGVLLYAALRAPRYLYEGVVDSCEGSEDAAKCGTLSLSRGNGSGKLFAPFAGVLSGSNGTYFLTSDSEPTVFIFRVPAGTPAPPPGRVKSGALMFQCERVEVTAVRRDGTAQRPMAPSTWLVSNAMTPTKKRTDKWCEDRSHLIVPKCDGVTFVPPTLPRFSLRAIQVTQ